MPAYVLFIRIRTNNPAELEVYSQKAPASLAGRPATIHALYGRHEVIEGEPIEGAAILEFPSVAEAKAWDESPAYRDARLRGAEDMGIIVEGFMAPRFRPYVETCIAAFGTSRSMFESNFPVDKISYSYPVFWNACKLMAKGASSTEKADLFGGTAARCYRLNAIG